MRRHRGVAALCVVLVSFACIATPDGGDGWEEEEPVDFEAEKTTSYVTDDESTRETHRSKTSIPRNVPKLRVKRRKVLSFSQLMSPPHSSCPPKIMKLGALRLWEKRKAVSMAQVRLFQPSTAYSFDPKKKQRSCDLCATVPT